VPRFRLHGTAHELRAQLGGMAHAGKSAEEIEDGLRVVLHGVHGGRGWPILTQGRSRRQAVCGGAAAQYLSRMAITLNAYLGFKDAARAAMEFYKSVFGGKLTISTFKELHASKDPSEDNLVMHSDLEGEDGVRFMASDTPNRMEYRPGTNFSMSLSGTDEKKLTGFFNKLAAGGKVTQPLTKATWGDTFGMLVDKFGVTWLVNVAAPR